MEDFENFLSLILYFIFLGALLAGAFYMGYRYRDNQSLERQKKYRPSELRGTSRAPPPSATGSEETIESPTT